MIKVPLETKAFETDSVTLACPECGEGYLHHGDVVVWDREFEDAPKGTVTTVKMDGVNVKPNAPLAECPSGRRDAVQIRFFCESCHGQDENKPGFFLNIIQHKGNTFLQWRT